MKTVIMALTIEPRSKHAPKVQEILTKYGCIIKNRIGIHETGEDECSNLGLIVLHIKSQEEDAVNLKKALEAVEGVKVNYMVI